MARRRRRRRRSSKILLMSIAILIMILIYAIFLSNYNSFSKKVMDDVEYQAGKELSIDDFLIDKGLKAEFSSYSKLIDTSVIGEYKVAIKSGIFQKKVGFRVVDTSGPTVVAKKITIMGGTIPKVEDCIESISDAGVTTVRFAEEYDFEIGGTIDVVIEARDAHDNITLTTTSIKIVYDTEPPVIDGPINHSIEVGESISFKNLFTISDDIDDDVDIKIDNSNVNTAKSGNYDFTVTATDDAGNVAVKEACIIVMERSGITIEQVNELADSLLEKITNDSMSDYDKAYAIYRWTHDNIAYADHTPKIDAIEGAYQGLKNKRGDCYTYAMTSKFLLSRANIKNMDIEKIPAESRHYWNLIDLGDGWYHFDTTRRIGGAEFFYKTDAELMEYSNSHKLSHNYDKSLYPTIQ